MEERAFGWIYWLGLFHNLAEAKRAALLAAVDRGFYANRVPSEVNVFRTRSGRFGIRIR
jgi:hypothetical protein